MANHSPFFKATRISAAVAIFVASHAWAQQNPTEITITDKLPSQVSGFSDVSARELPFSTTTITSSTLQDIGATRLSDALHLDASVTDSYNSPAFWDMLSVRGFTLDNRYNYRREGLPISAETMIPMDNKERIELLKGTSGIQAGTSAPGGLVNYVVKRAPVNGEQKIRSVTMSFGEGNNRLVAADLGSRFGNSGEFGYRFNVAHEDLNPYIKETTGHRDLVALAIDWRLKPGTVVDFEFEQSHREQIGVNGYSVLGTGDPATAKLPAPADPRINLTRQSWSQPGVFDAMTGSVRLRQSLENDWQWTTQVGRQHLRANDRLAWASGSSPITNMFDTQGNFDLYDWRSENEHRFVDALSTEITGSTTYGHLRHDLSFNFIRQRMLTQMPTTQTSNYMGVGNVLTLQVTPCSAACEASYSGVNLAEYSSEFGAKDRIHLSELTSAWLGLRYNRINRSTAGSEPTHDERDITTPWIGLSYKLSTTMTAYASYGEGVESAVVPNQPAKFTNSGQPLPTLRSKQQEIGVKVQTLKSTWQASWFDITRPAINDFNQTRQIDGEAHHQGVELSGQTTVVSQWNLAGGYTWLDAKRQNSTVTTNNLNGQRPINVPAYILRASAEYRFSSVPGLRSGLRISREGERNVTEYGEIKLPTWTTLGASTHYDTKVNNIPSTWTLAVENLADKQYWRESPSQYGHYYLYPGAPRTFRATVQFRL